jgi:hypothetical protein
MERGNDGPEMKTSKGNKGGKMGKNRMGRVEDRGEPGMAASVQAGHLDQMIRNGL